MKRLYAAKILADYLNVETEVSFSLNGPKISFNLNIPCSEFDSETADCFFDILEEELENINAKQIQLQVRWNTAKRAWRDELTTYEQGCVKEYIEKLK